MFIELRQTLIIRKEVNTFEEVTLPVLPETEVCSFQANFKFENRVHTVVLVGKYSTLVRNSRPEKKYKSLSLMVFNERNATPDMKPIMLIFIPLELFPKRLYFTSSSCTQCISNSEDTRLQCILNPEKVRTCLPTTINVNGENVEVFDVHKFCNRKGQREFIMHLIDTVGMLYNKVLENENNADPSTKERGVRLSEMYTYKKQEEEREKELLKKRYDKYVEECIEKGLYVEMIDDRAVIHFRYNGKDYKRTRKCSRETAARILNELKDHIIDGKEASSVVHTLLKSIRTKPEANTEEVVVENVSESEHTEIEMLKQRISALEVERDELRNSLYVAKNTINNLQIGKTFDGNLCFNTACEDLFPDEVKYQILSILKHWSIQNAKSGARVTRRQQVIQDLLERNPVEDLRKQVKDNLSSSILQLQNNPTKLQSALQALGYEVEKNGQGHWFVYPRGHREYGVGLASTPSDNRSRRNEIARMLNVLF